MDEPIQEQQPDQNIENKHSLFLPFTFQRKFAILIFVSLFFIKFALFALIIIIYFTLLLGLASLTPT